VAERGVSVTAVGRITAGSGLRLLDQAGKPMSLARLSFSHF
jgi:hypothetical protein